ncbi:Ankyrin-1 [Hondaea fermentalgiana]|uniref:Ankyrin-1 n=1 Tax=Hondaea fermentalgiana TaxID=2315210 RepID=A0A2R5GKF7_9STRA|nr:Ankyrin-1 [Hondaea fermentalgiana]|eukprot:GBG31360.1 Ankyrin-1 [Hondaea fermentalgiana]
MKIEIMAIEDVSESLIPDNRHLVPSSAVRFTLQTVCSSPALPLLSSPVSKKRRIQSDSKEGDSKDDTNLAQNNVPSSSQAHFEVDENTANMAKPDDASHAQGESAASQHSGPEASDMEMTGEPSRHNSDKRSGVDEASVVKRSRQKIYVATGTQTEPDLEQEREGKTGRRKDDVGVFVDCDLIDYALFWAATEGQDVVVREILKQPRLNPSKDGHASLRVAAQNGHVSVVKLLLADSRTQRRVAEPLVLASAVNADQVKVVRFLVETGFSGNVKQSLLARSAKDEDGLLMLKLLMDFPGVDLARDGYATLQEAFLRDDVEMAEEILEHRSVRLDEIALMMSEDLKVSSLDAESLLHDVSAQITYARSVIAQPFKKSTKAAKSSSKSSSSSFGVGRVTMGGAAGRPLRVITFAARNLDMSTPSGPVLLFDPLHDQRAEKGPRYKEEVVPIHKVIFTWHYAGEPFASCELGTLILKMMARAILRHPE